MMTYYEELGVPAEASHEEIRRAYKRLVRLLHPDRCGDPATRLLAGLQMRRLNGILEMLGNPGERANYDRSLARLRTYERDMHWRHMAVAGECPPPRQWPPWHNWWRTARWRRPTAAPETPCPESPGSFVWWRDPQCRPAAAVAAVLGLLLFCVLMPSNRPVPTPVAQAAAQEPPPALPKAQHRAHARSSPATAAEEQAPATETLAWDVPPAPAPPSEVDPPERPQQTATRTVVAGTGDSAPAERPNALTGDWFFVPAGETMKSGYPPEYIELRLVQNQGILHGRYRARYRVTDRAISPTVAFQFEGRTKAEGGVLPWRGPGGAQGEITLRLLANGNLEVAWAAGQLGEELGLMSGTATLIRKLE